MRTPKPATRALTSTTISQPPHRPHTDPPPNAVECRRSRVRYALEKALAVPHRPGGRGHRRAAAAKADAPGPAAG
jgi:hypothetical protein